MTVYKSGDRVLVQFPQHHEGEPNRLECEVLAIPVPLIRGGQLLQGVRVLDDSETEYEVPIDWIVARPQSPIDKSYIGLRVTALVPAGANSEGRDLWINGTIFDVYDDTAYSDEPEGSRTVEIDVENGIVNTWQVAADWIQ